MERSAPATPTREVSCGRSGSCRSRCWSRLESRRPPRRTPAAIATTARAASRSRPIARGLDSPRHLAFNDARRPVRRRGGARRRRDDVLAWRRRGPGAAWAPRGAVTKIDRRGRQYRIVVRARLAGEHRPRRTGRQQRRSARTASSSPGDDKRPDHQRRPDRPDDAGHAGPPLLTREDARRRQNPVAEPVRQACCKITQHGRPVQLADIWDFERDFNPDATVGNPRGRLQRRRPARGRQPARRRRRRRQRAATPSTSTAASRTSRCSRTARPCRAPFRGPADPAAGRPHVRRARAPTASTTSASSPASRSRSAPRTSTASTRRTGAADRVRHRASPT